MILISTHAEADFADLIAASPAIGFLSKSELSVDAISRILNEAPSPEAAIEVHREAHGLLADEIVEVKEGA